MSSNGWTVRLAGANRADVLGFVKHDGEEQQVRVRWRREGETPRCDQCGHGMCDHAIAVVRAVRNGEGLDPD